MQLSNSQLLLVTNTSVNVNVTTMLFYSAMQNSTKT